MKRIVLLVLLLLIVGVQASFAQSLPELSEQYTSEDGSLVIHHPDTWEITTHDEVIVLSPISAAAEVRSGSTMPSGTFAVVLVVPSQLPNVGLDQTADPAEALHSFADRGQFTGNIKPYIDLAVPAASVMVSNINVARGEFVAMQFDAGTVLVMIEFSPDVDDYADEIAIEVAHILSGFSYEGQSAGIGERNSVESSEVIRQWARAATGTSQYGEQSWGFVQATGAPNTDTCGDNSTAWASRSSTGADRLTLMFDQAVIPAQVNIHQTFNPGSIIGVELFNVETGETVGIPNSVDPPGNTPCPGVFTLNISNIATLINGVVIYVDQEIGGSWNEIDAVELVGYDKPFVNIEALLEAARNSISNTDYEAALEPLNTVLEADSVNADALFHRGRTNYYLGNYQQAWSDFDNALFYGFSDSAWNYTMRGLAYDKLGNYEEAIADFDQAIEIDDDYLAPLLNRAFVNSERLGNWEAAVSDYRKLVSIDPSSVNVKNGLGWALVQIGQYDEALTVLDSAIRISPDYDSAIDSRGWAHLGLGDYDAAQKDFERAIELGNTYSYYGLGELYSALGDTVQALENLHTYVDFAGAGADPKALDLIARLEAAPTAEIRQWANFATGSSQYGEQGWSFMQATGAPDTVDCGDSLQAWASASVSNSEILALEFEDAVIPVQVNIYQNYNPGAITRIELTNTETSAAISVPDSADSPGNTPCPGVFSVDISGVDTPINGVILYLDQSRVGDWNEIDAVELVGMDESFTSSARGTAQPNATSEAESTFVIISDLDMSETFTFDGANHLTINYPAGWVTDVSQLPAIASSEDALAALQRGAPLPEGEIAIGIIPPKDMPNALGVTPSDSASETLSDLATLFGVVDVEMGSYPGLDYPAFSAPLTGTRMLPPNTHILTVEHENGVVTFLIVTETLNGWDQLIGEMIASLSMS